MKQFCLVILLSVFASLTATPLSNDLAFKLYPNPLTGDVLQVNFDLEYKNITNVIGQSVFTHAVTDDEVKKGHFTVNVEDLQLDKGVYLTKLHNGEQSSVQKLIVR
jgi:hypothetical protein